MPVDRSLKVPGNKVVEGCTALLQSLPAFAAFRVQAAALICADWLRKVAGYMVCGLGR